MDDKQAQQYRQHFNLSETTKRMLEELTAQRYPGKQRRQSQLIEDLITEAFTKKEQTMSAVTAGMHEPEPGRLASLTIEAVNMAQQEALYIGASELQPEHLFLGLLKQGNEKVVKVLHSLGIDVQALRVRVVQVFGTSANLGGKAQEGQSSKNSEEMGDFNEVATVSDSLSLKRAGVDPWTTIGQRYTAGQVVMGTITRIASFGVFARIEDGVEGLIHLSEITPGTNLKRDLHEGQQVQIRILRIDPARRRLSLSMRLTDQVVDQGIGGAELPELLEGNVPEPFEIVLPLSRDSRECISWAKSFAWRSMQSAMVMPEHLLMSVLRHRRMRSFFMQLLPATEPLLVGLNEGMGYTSYIDQLIRTKIRGHLSKLERVGRGATVVGWTEDPHLCPSCRGSVQAHWKHCAYCGALLSGCCPVCGAPKAEVEGVHFCYECGSLLEMGMKPNAKSVTQKRESTVSSISFSKGQGVRIVDGAFTEFIGTVTDVDMAQGKITVLISFFGTKQQVVLDFFQVEKI